MMVNFVTLNVVTLYRTNPKANVKLSGKKKKLLLKEAKRLMNEKKQMDGECMDAKK